MPYLLEKIKLDKDIAHAKNVALKKMLQGDGDFFFLIEDNCKVIDELVFDKFIEASQKTGIEALCWAKGATNKNFNFKDDPFVEYYSDFPTAFTMFTRNAVTKAGFLDEKMPVNTWQDLEYVKRIGDLGLSTPFGMFAAPKGVDKYLELTGEKDEFKNLKAMEEALRYWELKDGYEFPRDVAKKRGDFELKRAMQML